MKRQTFTYAQCFPLSSICCPIAQAKTKRQRQGIRTRYQARPHRYQPLEYGSRLLNMLSIRMLTSACNWERTGTCKSTPSGDSIPVHHLTLHSAYAKPTLLARMCQTPLTTSIRIKKQKGYAVAQFGCLD